MVKIDIFSGFLGAGKTTLIKKLIKEVYSKEKVVLIENEFGSIGIDGEFMKDSGIMVNELNSGCICCSLVGDFSKSLKEVISTYNPDRIVIEPSGVGKLSDVVKAVVSVEDADLHINGLSTVVDANKCKMYMKNFGEFFNNQIENASCVILSHTSKIGEDKLNTAVNLIKEKNDNATIITTDWDKLSGEDIMAAIEHKNTLLDELEALKNEHDGEHDDECHCHEGEHHHHHEHDEECHCHEGEHQHHHEHGEECHCHDHDHHHADEVFTSWGMETVKKFTKEEIANILKQLENREKFGYILRSKGIVASCGEEWIHFDYVPSEPDVRYGTASVCGRICVIGSEINEEEIKKLFS